MKTGTRTVAVVLTVVLGACAGRGTDEAVPAPSYESTLRSIAQSIEELKGEYPQLSEFSASAHCNGEQLRIDYAYRTVAPQRTGGWTSGVPSPTDQGVWLFIDFHDPDSKLQMHTQPLVPRYRLRGKEVMVQLLEGAGTKTLDGKLARILVDHGARPVHPVRQRDR